MDYSKMSKEEIRKELDRLVNENEVLRSSKGIDRKSEVLNLLEKGINEIEVLSERIGVKEKNISSILSGLRKDLKVKGKGIISVKFDKKNFVVLMKLEEINELLSLKNFGKFDIVNE